MSDKSQRVESQMLGVQSAIEDSADRNAYDARNGIRSRHYLTMVRPEDTDWIIARLRQRVTDKVVVEIGAGVGLFACELAKYAKHVYAIEVDLAWSWMFMRYLYRTKPQNLTWIIDRAETLVDVIRGDVCIVLTGSDEVALRTLAGRFAPEVVMPWQDWNDNKAVVAWGHWGAGRSSQRPCQCIYSCALQTGDVDTSLFGPGTVCQLRMDGVRVPTPEVTK